MSSSPDYTLYPFSPPPADLPVNHNPLESQGNVLIVPCSIFLAIMILFYAIRMYAKLFIKRKFQWDDATCTVGFLLTVGYYVCCILSVQVAFVGRHSWDVTLGQVMTSSFFPLSYAEAIICPAGLGFIKLTFFLLYMHLFRPLSGMRVAIWIGGSISALFYTVIVILTFIFVTPRSGETYITHLTTSLQHDESVMSVPFAAISMVIDLYILVLPIVGVWQLQLPTRQKFAVAVVFMTGAMACLAAMLTLYYRVQLQKTDDLLWILVPTLITSIVEMMIGVICTCAPAFSQTLREHLPPYEMLKSQLQSSFRTLGKSRSKVTSESSAYHRQNSANSNDNGFGREHGFLGKASDQSLRAYGLGKLGSTKALVESGREGSAEAPGIRLEQHIRQNHGPRHADAEDLGRNWGTETVIEGSAQV